MNSFITGSHAYGIPNEKSDIDLVVLADEATFITMQQNCRSGDLARKFDDGGWSFKFGTLNIIGVTSPEEFQKWRDGTDYLKTISPVSRQAAVDHFTSLGLTNQVSAGNG